MSGSEIVMAIIVAGVWFSFGFYVGVIWCPGSAPSIPKPHLPLEVGEEIPRRKIIRGLRESSIRHLREAVRLTKRGDAGPGGVHEAWSHALTDAAQRIDDGSWK